MTTVPTTRQYLSGHSRPATGALNGLIAPLQQLDRRLQQTIEVTQVLCGTAFQQYLLGSIVPAAAPADVVSANSALGQLKTNFGLSDFEVNVVVMAIAPELDRRYERLYATLQSTSARKPTLALALSVLCSTEADKQAEQARLLTDSPLRQLLQPLNTPHIANAEKPSESSSDSVKETSNHPRESYPRENRQRADRFEGQTLQLKTAVSRYLLNQRSIAPLQQLTTYCQLSWPQRHPLPVHESSNHHAASNHAASTKAPSAKIRSNQSTHPFTEQNQPNNTDKTVSNNPVLAALISRIQQAEVPFPLSLQFHGQRLASKQKQQAAERVAIASQSPLLRVNLSQLIHEANLNAEKSTLAVEQVILQSQLWQAVLYLEDTAEFPIPVRPFIHPGLIEKLSVQLAHYPGITIFAGSSPHMPTANGGKGILSISLTESLMRQQQPEQQTKQQAEQQTKQQPVISATQLALNEIEKFRLMLMQSSVEFG